MGIFTRDIKSMDDLFIHMLRDIYYAENQIVKGLQQMIDKASDTSLVNALRDHLEVTKNQITRLEQVFDMEGIDVKGVSCPAIDGIIEEAQDIAGEIDDSRVMDAAIVAAAQSVEHYEITRYGTLIAWARELRRENAIPLLSQTLEEEKMTDRRLTELAESRINIKTNP